MDGPDAKRFLRWFFAVEYYHLLIAIFSLLCIFFCGAPAIALVNPGSSRAHRHTCTCRSGLAIFLLDEDSQGKSIGPWWWFATQTLGSEWKAWSMSLWELIQTSSNNWIQTCFWVWKDGATVILQLHWQVSYHTIQLERCKRKRRAVKHASDAEVEV